MADLTAQAFLSRADGPPPLLRRYVSWPFILIGMGLMWLGYVGAGMWHVRRQPDDPPDVTESHFNRFFIRQPKNDPSGLRLYANWPFVIIGIMFMGAGIVIGGVWAPTFDEP